MIALILLLVHGAFIVSVYEEWRDRGLTDTSYRVLAMMLLASILGIWLLETETWSFDVLSVSTALVSAAAAVVYVYWLLLKLSDLLTRYLHRRDPLRSTIKKHHLLRHLLKKR
ncbi:MAG: hypothetical protein KGP14_15855 [Betaproteobacteria bacterium]|nr:hypothetical protein [Betaproteobacteria bacterium]